MNNAWTIRLLQLTLLFQVLTLHLEVHPPSAATVEAVVSLTTTPLAEALLLVNHLALIVAGIVDFPLLAVAATDSQAIARCAKFATNSAI
jgi:hypothetical protein